MLKALCIIYVYLCEL